MGIFAGVSRFDIIESIFIVANFLLSIYTLYLDVISRKTANLIALKQQYREIWQSAKQPPLSRVMDPEVNLIREPLTEEEELFVAELVFHMHAAMRAGIFVSRKALKQDARNVFTLPIPKAGWEKIRPLQSKRLVRFIDRACRPSSVKRFTIPV